MRKWETFGAAAFGLAIAEVIGLSLIDEGISTAWEGSPHPVAAVLLLVVLGVVTPSTFVYLLWAEERKPGSFVLLLIAASTIVLGSLMAVGATLALQNGQTVPLWYYVPLAIAITSLMARTALNRRRMTAHAL